MSIVVTVKLIPLALLHPLAPPPPASPSPTRSLAHHPSLPLPPLPVPLVDTCGLLILTLLHPSKGELTHPAPFHPPRTTHGPSPYPQHPPSQQRENLPLTTHLAPPAPLFSPGPFAKTTLGFFSDPVVIRQHASLVRYQGANASHVQEELQGCVWETFGVEGRRIGQALTFVLFFIPTLSLCQILHLALVTPLEHLNTLAMLEIRSYLSTCVS